MRPPHILQLPRLPPLRPELLGVGTKDVFSSRVYILREDDEFTFSHQDGTRPVGPAACGEDGGFDRFAVVQRDGGVQAEAFFDDAGEVGHGADLLAGRVCEVAHDGVDFALEAFESPGVADEEAAGGGLGGVDWKGEEGVLTRSRIGSRRWCRVLRARR